MSALTWGGTLLTEPLSAGTRHRMRLVNVCVGVVLGAEGVLMLMLTGSLSLPVTASFLRNNPVAVQGPAPVEVLFRLAIGPSVAVFLLLTMADQLLVAAPGVHGWYEAPWGRQANYARWIEYSMSVSIMIVLTYMFTGIRDIDSLRGDGQVVVVLRGALDVAEAAKVAASLAVVAASGRTVIVDLEGLEFIDSSGLAALVRTRQHARRAGCDLVLAAPQQQVLRMLAITRLIDVFAIYPCADEAAGIPVVTTPEARNPALLAMTCVRARRRSRRSHRERPAV